MHKPIRFLETLFFKPIKHEKVIFKYFSRKTDNFQDIEISSTFQDNIQIQTLSRSVGTMRYVEYSGIVFQKPLNWRHNGRDGVSNHQPRDCLPFIHAQIKENTKAPCHWPLCGEFTGDRYIPRIKGQ